MITLYRPAYYTTTRAPEFTGLSIDIKPFNVENGAVYKEIDTGRTYRYDNENKQWYEWQGNSMPTPSITVEPITITENGTTTAPSGKAYSPVTVNVPASGATEPYIEETYSRSNLVSAKMYGYSVIRGRLFSSCASLTGVAIYNDELINLKTIGDYAFYGCNNLTTFQIPDSVTSIGESAFQNCKKYNIATLPSSLTVIKSYAFDNCAITTIEIPTSVITMYAHTFSNCTSLTSVTFNGTPTNMGAIIFDGCTNLTTINVPWAEGAVANAPWGATNAMVNYNYTKP